MPLMQKSPRTHFRLLTALLLTLSVIAAACGGSDPSTTEASTEIDQAAADDYSDFKVVMILDGSAEDGGWNTTHLRSGRKVEANFPGIDFSFVEDSLQRTLSKTPSTPAQTW